jgi:TonB family protein
MKPHLLIIMLVAVAVVGYSDPEIRTPPQVTYQPPPIYPAGLRSKGISGRVVVGFIVDVRGVPADLFIMQSSRREFDLPAVVAVRAWRFKPGTLNGKPVNTKMSVPMIFDPQAPKLDQPSTAATKPKTQIKALIEVRFYVDAEGAAQNVVVVSSTAPAARKKEFEDGVVNATKQQRFDPSIRGRTCTLPYELNVEIDPDEPEAGPSLQATTLAVTLPNKGHEVRQP